MYLGSRTQIFSPATPCRTLQSAQFHIEKFT
jgi:hypothetical protein